MQIFSFSSRVKDLEISLDISSKSDKFREHALKSRGDMDAVSNFVMIGIKKKLILINKLKYIKVNIFSEGMAIAQFMF